MQAPQRLLRDNLEQDGVNAKREGVDDLKTTQMEKTFVDIIADQNKKYNILLNEMADLRKRAELVETFVFKNDSTVTVETSESAEFEFKEVNL